MCLSVYGCIMPKVGSLASISHMSIKGCGPAQALLGAEV